jgi:hypothetical protein
VKIFFWLLPFVDIFRLPQIVDFYRGWGVEIPLRHAKAGLVERLVGYLPVGVVGGHFLGATALLLFLLALPLAGGPEFYLMSRGFRPWTFFRGKPRILVLKVFLLEAYNASAYFMLGVMLGILF